MCKINLTLKEIKDMCQKFDARHKRLSHFGDPLAVMGEIIEHELEQNPAWVLKHHGLPAYKRLIGATS